MQTLCESSANDLTCQGYNVVALVSGGCGSGGGTGGGGSGGGGSGNCGTGVPPVDCGTVLEQYTYEPYGELIVAENLDLDPATGGSRHAVNRVGFQGLFFERFDGDYTQPTLDTRGGSAALECGAFPATQGLPGVAGLYYARNRFYNPALGRFIQRDPNETGLPIIAALASNGEAVSILFSGFDAGALYGDGVNLYLFAGANPVNGRDPSGLDDDVWADFDDAIGGLYQDRLGAYGYTRDALGQASRGSFLAQLYAHMAFAWVDLVWDINESILLDLIAGPFLSTICFVEGTPVATPDGPLPIECLPLGCEITSLMDPQRGTHERTELPPGGSAVSIVRLQYRHADGSLTMMELLRPAKAIASLKLTAGCCLPIVLPELGLAGDAEVLAVEPYGDDVRWDVPVVTGRFVTDTAGVVNVYMEGHERPIGVTPKHPMFSVDRNAWVASSELQPGEWLTTLSGIAIVTCVDASPMRAKVYNVEVSRFHTYFVGEPEVWVHNPCKLSADVRPRGNATSLKGARWPAVRHGNNVYVAATHGHARDLVMGGTGSNWVGKIPVSVEEGFVEFLNATGTAYRFFPR